MKGKVLFCFAILVYPLLAFSIPPIVDLDVEYPLPRGATFNTTTGEFYWKPTTDQVGEYRIKFKVTDGHGGYDDEVITITVTPTGG